MIYSSASCFRLLVIAGCSVCFQAAAAEPEDPLATAQKAASAWIQVRTENTRLETDWRNEHALLASTVKGLTERATTVEEKLENLEARTPGDRKEIESMRAKQQKEAAELARVDHQLKLLAEKLGQMRDALPPRLSTALDLPYKSLAASQASVGERMQYVMVILNRCAQFNHLIETGEEVLTLDDIPKSLEVIYWGLSHGYALDRRAKKAWLGSPVSGHWQWRPLPDSSDEVTQLIAIAHDQVDPQFVSVPAPLALSASGTQ